MSSNENSLAQAIIDIEGYDYGSDWYWEQRRKGGRKLDYVSRVELITRIRLYEKTIEQLNEIIRECKEYIENSEEQNSDT